MITVVSDSLTPAVSRTADKELPLRGPLGHITAQISLVIMMSQSFTGWKVDVPERGALRGANKVLIKLRDGTTMLV